MCGLTCTVCRSGIPLYTDIWETVCLPLLVLVLEMALLLLGTVVLVVLVVLGVLLVLIVEVVVFVEELEVFAMLALEAGGPCSPSIVPP